MESTTRLCWVDFMDRVEDLFHFCYKYLPVELRSQALWELEHRLKRLQIDFDLAHSGTHDYESRDAAIKEHPSSKDGPCCTTSSTEDYTEFDNMAANIASSTYTSSWQYSETWKKTCEPETYADKHYIDNPIQSSSHDNSNSLKGRGGVYETAVAEVIERENTEECTTGAQLKVEDSQPAEQTAERNDELAEDAAPRNASLSSRVRRSTQKAPKYTDFDLEAKEEIEADYEPSTNLLSHPVKRPRGRPRKHPVVTDGSQPVHKPKRGRPKKIKAGPLWRATGQPGTTGWRRETHHTTLGKEGSITEPPTSNPSGDSSIGEIGVDSSTEEPPLKRGPGRPRHEVTVLKTEEVPLEGEFTIDDIHCKSCNRTFIHVDLYKKHIEEHETRPRYGCYHCGKQFLKFSTLELHLKSHIPNMLKCPHCYFFTEDQRTLDSHLTRHSDEKTLMCDECGKAFRRPSALKRHKMMVHEEGTIKLSYNCKECDFTTSSTGSLKSHIKNTHRHRELLYCHICGRGLKHKVDLEGHLASHRGEKKFACKICNKHFATDSQVRAHHAVHMPHKYSCTICGKKFQRRSHMNRHKIIHTSDKPWSCIFNVCKYQCKFKANLRKHCKAVHGKVYPPVERMRLEKIGVTEIVEKTEKTEKPEISIEGHV